jgi:lipid-binding SYLF domain-containing protein
MISRRMLLAGMASSAIAAPAMASDRAVIDNRVQLALERLYAKMPDARELASRARGMLVMPSVLKGGFILGGAYGEGALLTGGASGYMPPAAGYYSVASASFGLQLGVQTTSHVLFFMTDDALERFRRKNGWQVGADAEVTWPGDGVALRTDSTLMNKPVIGIVFDQDGFLVGASLEGAKYSPIRDLRGS